MKNNDHFSPFSSPFSLDIHFLPANFLIESFKHKIYEKLKIVALYEVKKNNKVNIF